MSAGLMWLGRVIVLVLLLLLPRFGAAQDATEDAESPTEVEATATTEQAVAGGYSDQDVRALAERVKAMKPKAAGMMLAQLPVKLSAAVILTLTPRTGGRIMNYVPAPQAAAIAAEMAGKKTEES